MPETISEKSTKSQILEAYNEAVRKLKESKQEDRKAEKKKEEETKIVKQASDSSTDKIVNTIGTAKIEVLNALDDVGEKLAEEFKRLVEIRKAIEIESKYLDDIYEIKVNADTLSALLLSQKEKKVSFEAEVEGKRAEFDEEMALKKLQWKQEQETYEKMKKEKEAGDRKEREREEEEYNYKLRIERKKDEDAYAEKKALLEKELLQKRADMEGEFSDREAVVSAKEKEYTDLKARVEQFPKQLEDAIKETEKSVTEKIELKYKHQLELIQKETDGERNLNKQIIHSLEDKIKQQADLIRQLTQKADDAGQQVQMIAIKAIEGASAQRSSSVERTSEQSKT